MIKAYVGEEGSGVMATGSGAELVANIATIISAVHDGLPEKSKPAFRFILLDCLNDPKSPVWNSLKHKKP